MKIWEGINVKNIITWEDTSVNNMIIWEDTNRKKQKYGKMGKISKKGHNGLNCTQRNGEEVPRKA